MHVATLLLDMIIPLAIRRGCAQFCKNIASFVVADWHWIVVIRSGGDAAINAVDAHCVHCVVNVWVRSVHLVAWRGKIDFFHDCKNHAQLD